MEKLRSRSVTATAALILMTAVWLMRFPAMAACPAGGGKACSNCIRDRMRLDCPACAPALRCMAQCLWGGASRSRCVKRCDCGGAWPRLSSCRQCMSRCKCSCAPSSTTNMKL